MGTALAFVVLHGPGDRGQARQLPGAGTLLRGLAAGGLAAAALAAVLGGRAPAVAAGAALGLAQALLSPRSDQGIGAAVVRGQAYGFVAWLVGELTVLPMLADQGLRWSLLEAREASRPARLAAAGRAGRGGPHRARPPGPAAVLRAPARLPRRHRGQRRARRGPAGAVAGLLGGAVISQLMLHGAVPEVAERLTGSNGPLAGIAVNLGIGVAIGVSYGLLFRRLGQDVTCALGWGLSYGFLWWVLGP